jgi:hypothetical protein
VAVEIDAGVFLYSLCMALQGSFCYTEQGISIGDLFCIFIELQGNFRIDDRHGPGLAAFGFTDEEDHSVVVQPDIFLVSLAASPTRMPVASMV